MMLLGTGAPGARALPLPWVDVLEERSSEHFQLCRRAGEGSAPVSAVSLGRHTAPCWQRGHRQPPVPGRGTAGAGHAAGACWRLTGGELLREGLEGKRPWRKDQPLLPERPHMKLQEIFGTAGLLGHKCAVRRCRPETLE